MTDTYWVNSRWLWLSQCLVLSCQRDRHYTLLEFPVFCRYPGGRGHMYHWGQVHNQDYSHLKDQVMWLTSHLMQRIQNCFQEFFFLKQICFLVKFTVAFRLRSGFLSSCCLTHSTGITVEHSSFALVETHPTWITPSPCLVMSSFTDCFKKWIRHQQYIPPWPTGKHQYSIQNLTKTTEFVNFLQ